MDTAWLDFERPLVELERKIEDLRAFADQENLEFSDELKKLEGKAERLRGEIYSTLTPWQRVQLARHPRRPYLFDYIPLLFGEFTELHGDRTFGDDAAIDPLLDFIAAGPPQVRRRAIAAITVFDDLRIEPAIRRAAFDRNPGVREAAEMVVGKQLEA